MNIIVCIKQVLDPEAPASKYRVDTEINRMTQPGVAPVLNPFDRNALEAALQIKDNLQTKITVLSMGYNLSKTVFRQTLALGANELILLDDEAFDQLDSYTTASVLAAAIQQMETYDLILTGIQAADWNCGIVGTGIAEILQIPCITLGRGIEILEGRIKVERETGDGYEIVEAETPALVTVGPDVGELRIARIREILAVREKPITNWDSATLALDKQALNQMQISSLYIPEKEDRCELIEGENEEELGINLALKLITERILV